jgi:hypothetical protein
MPESGINFDSLIQSLSGFGSGSANLADLSLTGIKTRTLPLIDYSVFGNHVFFGDGLRKFRNSIKKIENTYPIGLSAGDVASLSAANIFAVDQWLKEASGFEIWLLDELSATSTVTAQATNTQGENVFLTLIRRDEINTITGSQTAMRESISARAVDFEELNIDTIYKTSGSSNDHAHYPLTAETSASRGPNLKNMLPAILFDGDENDYLERMLQAFGDLLDDLKGFSDQINYTKHISYDDVNRVPNKFLPVLASHFGITLYQSAVNSAVESFLVNNSTTGMTNQEITYSLWNRIMNNLIYLLKNKGTREAMEAIGRIYGVDHNLLKTDEYSVVRGTQLVRVPEEVDTSTLFSTGDVFVQMPTGNVSALDYSISSNFTLQARVSITSADTHKIIVHPKYELLVDASGVVKFIDLDQGGTAQTSQSSISSFMHKKGNFVNIVAQRNDDTLNVYSLVLTGSGSGGNDIVALASAATAGFGDSNFDSSAGSASFGAYFPGSGSFNGYVHEVRSWSVPLHEEDLIEHTKNFESISFVNSTASNSATYGSLSAHWKLKENTIPTGAYNFIVDSTTGSNTANPVNFGNQVEKRYRVFSNMKKISSWYPTSLVVDNDKIRQGSDLEKNVSDPGSLGFHFTPISIVNRDIRNVIQNINVRDLLGDPAELYEPSYSGLFDSTFKDITTRYGNVVTQDTEAGAGLSAGANSLVDLNTFVDAIDNFNDVMGSIFPFGKQFLPAKSHLLSEGILVEPHILHRPKIKREPQDVLTMSPTSVKINNHFLELDATAASGATTASFQGYRHYGKQAVITNSISSISNIDTLSNKRGDSINSPRITDTSVGRYSPVRTVPSDIDASTIDLTISRRLISPTASTSAVNGYIEGSIRLLSAGKPFTTRVPTLKLEFPTSADGTNLFIAQIGDIDSGRGRIISGKDSEFTTDMRVKSLDIKLQLAEVVRSSTADVNTLSGELGVVNISITNLFNKKTNNVRVAIGSSQELFNEFGGQGGSEISS